MNSYFASPPPSYQAHDPASGENSPLLGERATSSRGATGSSLRATIVSVSIWLRSTYIKYAPLSDEMPEDSGNGERQQGPGIKSGAMSALRMRKVISWWIFALLFAGLTATAITGWTHQSSTLQRCLNGTELYDTRHNLALTKSSLALCTQRGSDLSASLDRCESQMHGCEKDHAELALELVKEQGKVDDQRRAKESCLVRAKGLQEALTDEQGKLDVCEASRAHLALELLEESDRTEEQRREKTWCLAREKGLQESLEQEEQRLLQCSKEESALREDLREGLVMGLLEWIVHLGTGGDSWVCSDQTHTWSFGHASESTPSSSSPMTIYRWSNDFSSSQSVVFQPGSNGARIVGYKITSSVIGGNGWWRKVGLDRFGGGEVTFEATAAFAHSAAYVAEVFYVSA